MSEDLDIRPATSGEVWQDMLLGDTWTLHPLQVDRATAVEAATRHWGPPSASMLPGESLWRLRAGDELPVYLSGCPSEDRIIVMFNSQCQPGDDLERAVLDILTEMLSDDT